ncbi:MAG TPA: peptidoglycan DD-metalloendopeptidase family protein [Solirubrobacteraceae bacterium]
MHARAARTGARIYGMAIALGLVTPVAAEAGTPGGAAPSPAPVATSASCVKKCPDLDAAAAGSLVRVRGRNLAGASAVLFYGKAGAKDNRRATPRRTTATSLDVVVPKGTRTGTVAVVSGDGQTSRATKGRLVIAQPAGTAAPSPVSATSSAVDARPTMTKAYFAGRRKAGLSFVLGGTTPQDVRVDLVQVSSQRSIAHWIAYAVQPGDTDSVTWNGKAGSRVAPSGRYEFRVAVGTQPHAAGATTPTGHPAQSTSATPPPPANAVRSGRVTFLDDMFPVRGRHDFGGAGNAFGAGRAGHTHQGQDVLAACGTKLVAERGGKVKWKATEGAAGNYVVIDNDGEGIDTVYMHLRYPAMVRKGQHVYTGQQIGWVGETGDATACHLHFEMWSAPGWYTGGSPFDPLPSLKAWDKTS